MLSQMCEPGKYQDHRNQAACIDCPSGSYSGLGAESCTSCPQQEVAPNTGSSSCLACPTQAQADKGHVSCEGQAGYYLNDRPSALAIARNATMHNQTATLDCERCPNGANCDSTNTLWSTLQTEPGWWRCASCLPSPSLVFCS